MIAVHTVASAEEGKIAFDIPVGDAATALKQYSTQAGGRVLYSAEIVAGVRTNGVQGEMSAREALERMLGGTKLQVVEDARSGALAVRRPDPRSSAAAASAGDKPSAVSSIQGDTVTLSPFEVSADAYNGYFASETLSGSKIAMKLIDVPATISVITHDLISDMGAEDPFAALQKGLGIVPWAVPAANQGVMIRGYRSSNWAVEGAPTTTFILTNNANYDTIEVIKGPAALLFGPFGVYGGYVNVQPKWASRDQHSSLTVGLGTANFYNAILDYAQPLTKDKKLSGRLVLSYQDSGRAGYPGDFFKGWGIAPSFSYDFNDRAKLKFRFELGRTNNRLSRTAMDANGAIIRDFSDQGPTSGFNHNGTNDHNYITQTVFTDQMNDEWSMKFQFMTNNELYDSVSANMTQTAANLVGGFVRPAATYLWQENSSSFYMKTQYIDYSMNWKKLDLDHGMTNDFLIGINMFHYKNEIWRSTPTGTASLYPQYNVPPYTTFNPTNPDWASIGNIVLDVNNQLQPYNEQWLGGMLATNTFGIFDKKLQFTAGARFNYDNRSSWTISHSTPSAPYTGNPVATVVNEIWLGRWGVVYQPIPTLAVYYGHDEGYLAVGSTFKFDGTMLNPESGKNDEIGLKLAGFHAFGGDWSGSLAYFDLKATNKARADINHSGFYLQDAWQRNKGVDGQIAYQSAKISGVAGFTTMDGPVSQTGARVTYAPQQLYYLWLKYSFTNAFSVGGGYHHVGSSLDYTGFNYQNSYGSGDVFASYSMTLGPGKIAYRLGVSNVGNTITPYLIVHPAQVVTEDYRQVKLTTTYTW